MARPKPDPRVVAFFDNETSLLISVVVLHELRFGCEAHTDAEQRRRLTKYVAGVQSRYASGALPVTLEIAESAALMRADAKRRGRVLVIADALIAATGLVHGLTLATRNVKDFADLGVSLFDPFQPA